MEPQYRIIPDLKYQNCLTVHPNTAKRRNMLISKKWFLRFGIEASEIRLRTSTRINEHEVKLSIGMIESLRIPICGQYEIRTVENEILIGPYIGILAAIEKNSIEKNVVHLTNYLYDYKHIGGVVAAFSLEGMDPSRYTIEGYVYNPDTNAWDQGVYSYPAAVFKIVHLGKTWRNHFQTVYGNRVFNSYVFNKWEMYEWFSEVPGLKSHLPETILYSNPQDLESFLHVHQQVYVKPLSGSMGMGIYKVSKTADCLKVDYNQDGVRHEKAYLNVYELADFFRSEFKGRKYMLQQALDLISVEGKKIDFRIVMVKDQAGVWKDMCMVARYGQPDSIVTNISAGGSADIGENTLAKIFGLSPEEVFRFRQHISQVIHEIAHCIEQHGVHCGNLGIDIAVDTQARIWIIEVNNLNPSPLIALDINDRPLFYQIKRMNMLYAKRLAGFPEEL